MDIDRTGDEDRCTRSRAGGPAQQRGDVSCGFRLPIAKLVLFVAALIALGAPQTLAFAASHPYAAADIVTDEEPISGEDYPPETIEEPSEPMIVDDLRTVGVMVAAACRTDRHERSGRAQEESILVFAEPTPSIASHVSSVSHAKSGTLLI